MSRDHNAWVTAGSTAAVLIPLYLGIFAWKSNRSPANRTGTSTATSSNSPLGAGGTSSRRGKSAGTGSALAEAWNGIGDESDEIEFFWPNQKGSYTIHAGGRSVTRSYDWKVCR